MNSNIVVINLVIFIFPILISGNEQPRWSNGDPIFNLTSPISYKNTIDTEDIIANLEDIQQSIYYMNLRLNNLNYGGLNNKTAFPATHTFDIRYDAFPPHCKNKGFPTNCAEATSCTRLSGIYKIIQKEFSSNPFLVECDTTTLGGDWTLIQRRHDGSVDFHRVWTDYAKGFGDIQGEFFIGLNKLHIMTNYNGPQELLFVLRDNKETRYAKYDNFVVGNEHEYYTLHHIGSYSGNAGDSFSYQLNQKFTTKDRDNDKCELFNCALFYLGAWWYNSCHKSNLNGKYLDNSRGKGLNWFKFRGFEYSLNYTAMLIRRRTY